MFTELYNTEILSLSATLKNKALDAPHGTSRKVSKLCGSWVEIDINLTNGRVNQAAIRLQACALGQASAAILKAQIIGANLQDLIQAHEALRAMLKDSTPPPHGRFAQLELLAGVAEYPARHASILLAFEAAIGAVEMALNHNFQNSDNA